MSRTTMIRPVNPQPARSTMPWGRLRVILLVALLVGLGFPASLLAAPPSAPANFAVTIEGGFVVFSWEASPEADVASYQLNFSGAASGLLDVGKRTSFSYVPPPTLGGGFRFSIAAVTSAGEASPPSNEVSFSFPADLPRFVGAEACARCHEQKVNDWRVSGHPYKLMPAREARNRPIPLPAGFTWDDISYVIGGYKWKARFMGLDGFIITRTGADRDVPGKNQYNLENNTWSDYEPGVQKPYDCGSCHTTGFSEILNQDGRPGIKGTWVSGGITCENCHGAGSRHAASGDPTAITKDSSATLCGRCHTRGAADSIPASGGFIRHQEQNNEFQASPHANAGLQCVTCHDPHKKAVFSITRTCESCHSQQAQDFTGSAMQRLGVRCQNCHMPKAMKSAIKVKDYVGDVQSHLVRINPEVTAQMFTADGLQANNAITLEFACLSCHADRDKEWAALNVQGIHALGKESTAMAR
ncbi:MAG: cytochrome c3 family protein [Candidatus Tectomicrobia bacterium]|nr:cytochrome c3 family protein [Candidatus Tectomicrobia bacterium]